MKSWIWLDPAVVTAVHEAQLAEHGGISGVRDATLLESALGKPQNLAAYADPDAAALAASYGYGISRNHPFLDGNKRTAFVAAELFLAINDCFLEVNDADSVLTMLQVAAGEISETQFADWLRQHLQARLP